MGYFASDGAEQIKNAVEQAYPDLKCYLNCLWHVNKNVKKKVAQMDENITKAQKKKIKKQIRKIADLETEDDFFKALNLAIREWKQFASNFTKYF